MTLHNAGASDEQLAADAASIAQQLAGNPMAHPHVVHVEGLPGGQAPTPTDLAGHLDTTSTGADPRRP